MQQQVLQNTFIPTHIIVGAEHKKSKKFDDNEPLQKIGGHYKINAITAYWDEKHIIGLQLYYKIGKGAIGDFLDAIHNKPEKVGKTHGALFEIGPDDYLLEINGRVSKDNQLNKIGFLTYRGKQASFGIDEGTFFSHKYDNHTFGGFIGGFREYVDFLHVPILPVPQDFLREFKPIQLNLNMNNQPVVSAEIKRNNTSGPSYGVINGNNSSNGGSIIQAKQDFMQINVPKIIPMKYNTNPVPQANQQNNQQAPQQFGQNNYGYPPQPAQNNNYGYPPQYQQGGNNNFQNNNFQNNNNFGQNNLLNSKYPVLKK